MTNNANTVGVMIRTGGASLDHGHAAPVPISASYCSAAIAAGKRPQTPHHQRFAMLFYGLVATGYLVQGMAGKFVGVLLRPAAALHAVLAILLAYASFSRTLRQGLFTAERR
jgi:hypothetical protein